MSPVNPGIDTDTSIAAALTDPTIESTCDAIASRARPTQSSLSAAVAVLGLAFVAIEEAMVDTPDMHREIVNAAGVQVAESSYAYWWRTANPAIRPALATVLDQ